MKLIILFGLFTFFAQAHDHRRFAATINVLNDPSAAANNLCVENGAGEDSWCENLASSVCSEARKKELSYEAEAQAMENETVRNLPPDSTPLAIQRSYMSMVAKVEEETAKQTNITADDLRKLTESSRAAMIRQVTNSPIGEAQKAQMTNRLASVTFSTGAEHVVKEKNRLLAANPGMSQDQAEVEASTFYTELCGTTGLVINAFFDAANNAFIVCPGMVKSMFDFGGDKEKALRGLEFPMAHELGHAIDGYAYEAATDITDASIYDSMKTCHESQKPGLLWEYQQGEIIADFWAGKVLSESYSNEKLLGKEVRDRIALGINGQDLCLVPSDNAHPSATFRVNNILSRDPQMRSRLECAEPTVEKPYCGINGAQPAS